jgi:hypothetical protein
MTALNSFALLNYFPLYDYAPFCLISIKEHFFPFLAIVIMLQYSCTSFCIVIFSLLLEAYQGEELLSVKVTLC